MLRLIGLTVASILTAEALIMLALESYGARLSVPLRILLDCSFLVVCVFPTLYFLVFKEMAEQIRRRREAELAQGAWSEKLKLEVEERTDRLQKANEDLLIEVQERAKTAMALRTALNETRQGKEQLSAILNAVNDALVVVDQEWIVLEVNRAAEIMFKVNAYDLQGKSLKSFLTPWSQGPADLDNFFSREEEEKQTYLVPPDINSDERWPVQMRFGSELEWNQKAATVVTFYYRSDLAHTVRETPMS
jgi:PAS domain S-box-containing protein